MKVRKKNVYYCDFCKKKSLRSLKIHEKHCTANPDRKCRLCDNRDIREIIDKYRKYFYLREKKEQLFGEEMIHTITPVFKKKFTLRDIINELDDNCPNCILAIIRCLGLNRYYLEKKFKFDYKEELGKWWESENALGREEDERSQYD